MNVRRLNLLEKGEQNIGNK